MTADQGRELLVKLRGGGRVSEVGSRLTAEHLDLERFYRTLATVEGATVSRSFDLDPDRAQALIAVAEEQLGRPLDHLDLFVRVRLPAGADAEGLLAALAEDPEVEYAVDASGPILPAMTPDFTPLQGYRAPAPVGIDAPAAHRLPGGDGSGIGICVIEFGFNPAQQDLPPVEVIYDPAHDLGQNADHGTAVLGEMAGLDNRPGVTGISFGARFFFASITGGSLPVAIGRALEVLEAGDVINFSLQYSDKGPVEYVPDVFAAIEIAVANGISVVEAAGNFATDLDTATNALGKRIWDPASPEHRDSGAVFAGAGAPTGDRHPQAKLALSSYGARVSCQAWGQTVVTCGGGDLFDGGPDARYTYAFGGTSASAPILAGAIASVQGILKARSVRPLSPERIRSILADPSNGTPQSSSPAFPAERFHIGPQPDLQRVVAGLEREVEAAATAAASHRPLNEEVS